MGALPNPGKWAAVFSQVVFFEAGVSERSLTKRFTGLLLRSHGIGDTES
jgi:hypothetical protein